jgi:8-oxo-dGTP diphosphatase
MQIRFDMVSCYVARPAADGDGHEFLQLRRHKDDYMGGTWQAIYGQSESGESPVAAVLREIREEAGLIPRELYRLDQVSVFYIASTDTLWHCVPFCAIVTREQPVVLNDEHDAARWVIAADAEKLFMWKDNRDAIRDIVNYILVDSLAKPHMRIPLP